MNDTLPILLEYATKQDWAMDLGVLQQMTDIVDRHIRGERSSAEHIAEVSAAKRAKGTDDRGFEIIQSTGMAVLPISGVIAKYARMVNGCSQPRGTSVETIKEQLRAARSDPRVQSIFLHIESPGGTIDGLADLAGEIYETSFEKPVVAFADDLTASAAYWLASQANVVYANQTADIGSIGVYTLYVDSSKRAEAMGFKFMIFRSGDNKGVGSPGIEISEENAAAIQQRIDEKFEIFLSAVMKGRGGSGLTMDNLRELADGRTFVAGDAANKNLIDSVMTMDQAMGQELPQVRDKDNMQVATAASVGNELTVNSSNKEQVMSETQANTAGAAENADRLRGVAEERERVLGICKALPGDEFIKVREKAIDSGQSVDAAKAMAFDESEKLRTDEAEAAKVNLDEANEKLKVIAENGTEAKASETTEETEAGTTATGDSDDAKVYEQAVEKFKAEGLSQGKAGIKAAGKYPKSHAAWKGKQPTTDRRQAQ